ncbi:hypothetical protein KAH55_05505, partial [bacterium]|nr:hypothetical protein [bacterium]
GNADETISVNANISGLAAGEYTTHIRLTDPNATNSPVDVPVTLTVIGIEPKIATSVNTLLFRAIAGGTSPSNKKILVTNSAGGTLNWTAQEYPETSWMSLSNTSGQSDEEITVSINISGLSGGTYTSIIRISDPNASNNPVDISVTLSMGPNIVVTTENFGGNGSDAEPFLIHQQTMKFHVDLTEDQKAEDVRYWVQVHMASYRSCTTQYQEKDLSWQQLEGREFEYTADMTGWYYLRVDVERDGVYNEEARIHVYVETPPLKPYTLPYTPPAWNVLPQPACEIMNAVSGSGDYTNPYILDSPIMQFRIDGSTDPNGEDDLRYGLFLWAIHMHGGLHPVYCKNENEPLAKNTFLYYDEIK